MKKKLLFAFIFAIFLIIFVGNAKCYAQDLDRITDYIVTVDPRMNDGSLDITYEISWKVLDSTTEGPLEWVEIGTPNSYFDNPRAMTNNIKRIEKYNGSYVKIVFDKKYYAGEEVKFKYKIHQSYMYKLSWGKCKYSFTPAWFTNAKVDKLTIKWNKDQVKSSNSKSKEDNYLVWNKYNMNKGEKLSIDIKYDKSAFSELDINKQYVKNNSNSTGSYSNFNFSIIMFIICLVIILVSIFGGRGGGGYYGHRGFYGGGFYGRWMCTFKLCMCE